MARISVKADTVLATPPLTVAAVTLAGISLQEWVYILTAIYTCLLIADWVWKKFKAWQERKIFRASMDLPDKRE